jgi:hypothetical protein
MVITNGPKKSLNVSSQDIKDFEYIIAVLLIAVANSNQIR